MTRRAVLSLYDKIELVEFARDLLHLGWKLIASGGTGRANLKAQAIDTLDHSLKPLPL